MLVSLIRSSGIDSVSTVQNSIHLEPYRRMTVRTLPLAIIMTLYCDVPQSGTMQCLYYCWLQEGGRSSVVYHIGKNWPSSSQVETIWRIISQACFEFLYRHPQLVVRSDRHRVIICVCESWWNSQGKSVNLLSPYCCHFSRLLCYTWLFYDRTCWITKVWISFLGSRSTSVDYQVK